MFDSLRKHAFEFQQMLLTDEGSNTTVTTDGADEASLSNATVVGAEASVETNSAKPPEVKVKKKVLKKVIKKVPKKKLKEPTDAAPASEGEAAESTSSNGLLPTAHQSVQHGPDAGEPEQPATLLSHAQPASDSHERGQDQPSVSQPSADATACESRRSTGAADVDGAPAPASCDVSQQAGDASGAQQRSGVLNRTAQDAEPTSGHADQRNDGGSGDASGACRATAAGHPDASDPPHARAPGEGEGGSSADAEVPAPDGAGDAALGAQQTGAGAGDSAVEDAALNGACLSEAAHDAPSEQAAAPACGAAHEDTERAPGESGGGGAHAGDRRQSDHCGGTADFPGPEDESAAPTAAGGEQVEWASSDGSGPGGATAEAAAEPDSGDSAAHDAVAAFVRRAFGSVAAGIDAAAPSDASQAQVGAGGEKGRAERLAAGDAVASTAPAELHTTERADELRLIDLDAHATFTAPAAGGPVAESRPSAPTTVPAIADAADAVRDTAFAPGDAAVDVAVPAEVADQQPAGESQRAAEREATNDDATRLRAVEDDAHLRSQDPRTDSPGAVEAAAAHPDDLAAQQSAADGPDLKIGTAPTHTAAAAAPVGSTAQPVADTPRAVAHEASGAVDVGVVPPGAESGLSVDVRQFDADVAAWRAEEQRLNEALAAREEQLCHQASQLALLQDGLEALQRRNETLVLQADKVNDDMDVLRQEFEKRLGVAERKVYALTKERDSLKRAAAKAISPSQLEEKDALIKQVMAEGEALSQTIMEHETALKRLRAALKEKDAAAAKTNAAVAAEKQRADSLQAAKSALEASLAEVQAQARAELEQQRAAHERELAALRNGQADRAAAQVLELEAEGAALSATLQQLRDALKEESARAAAAAEAHAAELAAAEARCRDAEARYEAAEAVITGATRDLVRQVEAQQEAARLQEAAWLSKEAALLDDVRAAEEAAAARDEAARVAEQRASQAAAQHRAALDAADSRVAALEAALSQALSRQSELTERLEAAEVARDELTQALRAAETEAREQNDFARELERNLRQQMAVARPAGSSAAAAASSSSTAAPPGPGPSANRSLAPPTDPAGPSAPSMTTSLDTEAAAAETARTSGNGGVGHSVEPPARDELDEVTSPVQLSSAGERVYRGGSGSYTEGSLMAADAVAREREVLGLRRQLQHVEAVRRGLEEELYKAAEAAEAGRQAQERERQALQDVVAMQARYLSAVELLGEKDERLAELQADLEDVKVMYREQMDFMANKLVELTGAAANGELPHST